MSERDKYEIISELARRRGFFWPSYEIYGGVSGFLTYGSLGSILKRRVEREFRRFFIEPLNILEMESSIVTPGKVFEASGHVKAFREPLVVCSNCGKKFRADHLLQEECGLSETKTEKLSLKEITSVIREQNIKCPECDGALGNAQYFMTMFTTKIGPYSEAVGFGRPEAAQGIFVEFRRLYETARERFPLGVVQIGRALRNEISPRQGPIRLREFTIADIEFFFDPAAPNCPFLTEVKGEVLRLIPAEKRDEGVKEETLTTVADALQKEYIKTEWQAYFMVLAKRFLNRLGVPDDKQHFIEKLEWERAHYSTQGYDQEIYSDRWGWIEVSGHNYRTDYDLRQHMKHSGADLQVFKEYDTPRRTTRAFIQPILAKLGPRFKEKASHVSKLLSKANAEDVESSFKIKGYYEVASLKIFPEEVEVVYKTVDETGRRFIPHVVEPSFGMDRLVYVTLEFAFNERENRSLLMLPRQLAPIQISVYPLVTKDGLAEKAREILEMLMRNGFKVEYDEAGSIGRRYARADEVGTPLCITVDYQTLKDGTVTIRDRDSWKQIRVKIQDLKTNLQLYFALERDFQHLGEIL